MTSLSAVVGDAQAQAHRTGATLSVDDPNGVGTLADDLLSFDEAIRIANGELEVGALSAAERLRVKGTPGAERRDLIRLPARVTITVEAGKALTPLIGNDGDTIDGTDAVMVAGEKGKGNGLLLASSNLAVIGFRARGFDKPLQVDFGGRKLRNITLAKMRLSMVDSKGTLLIVAAQSGEGSLDGLKVTDSVFETGGKKEGNLVYIGSAAAEGAGRPISNTLLQNVLFSRNQIKDGAIGMYIHGAISGRSTTNATTRRAIISDNVFAGQHDSPINVAGALPAVGATNTGITLEDVTITRNRLEAANWGIWMGHETFGFGVAPTFARKNRWRNISITDNIVRQGDFAGKAHCITLETASDSPGDAATDNVIENVRITGNDVRGCRNRKDGLGTGIVVYAGRNLSFGDRSISTATHNTLRNLTIAGNRVADSDRGIVVGGGYSLSVGQTTPHDGGDKLAKLDGSSTDNHLTGARIERNEIQDVTTGILVVGGEGAADSKVHRNSAQVVIARTNKVTRAASPCEVHANRQAASGNTVTAVCPRL